MIYEINHRSGCGLDITTNVTENKASVFIKTVLKATFGFPDILKIT